ncbi:MAG: divalent-cation tolerance protein CutA [Acidobacteriota bacterium]
MTDRTVLVVLCTVASEKEGLGIAQALVSREEAACVNLVPTIRSVYRWKGKVWKETEQMMLIKTTRPMLEDVRRTIKELHSYELPEILALQVSEGDETALSWIASSVKAGREDR